MKIGFIGLSHLGLIYSITTAAKGFDVIAYTTDESLAERCNFGDIPIEEPGFRELYNKFSEKIKYTSKVEELKECELVFYSLDIKTNILNQSDTNELTELIYKTVINLGNGSTVVLLSQVSPGYTRNILDHITNKLNTKIIAFYYQVETLVFGSAILRALEPERFIIGTNDTTAHLTQSFIKWHNSYKCPVIKMRYESAELSKIAINLYLVSTVTTTNTLVEICEAINADWQEIVPALKLDKRIGPSAYLNPGLGLSGGNLERDLETVIKISKEYKTESSIISAWQYNSLHRRNWVLRLINKYNNEHKHNSTIAILGLTYKVNTNSIKNSPSLELIKSLPHSNFRVHDPIATINKEDFNNVTVHTQILNVLHQSDILVIMTPWDVYKKLNIYDIKINFLGRLIIDPYAVLDKAECENANFKYYKLGSVK